MANPFEKVELNDDTEIILFTPRWQHMIDGKMITGQQVDMATGNVKNAGLAISFDQVRRTAAVVLNRDGEWIENEDLPWSESG